MFVLFQTGIFWSTNCIYSAGKASLAFYTAFTS